jgi:alginate O-acetyltransferase complex protein AlgI
VLFNSYVFIFAFLPIVLGGFFLLGRLAPRFATGWLFLASLVFYGWWNPMYLLLLLASIIVNFQLGRAISQSAGLPTGKKLLCLAVFANLLLLIGYKYFNFFLDTVSMVSRTEFPLIEIVLPIGISFYTFTQIAFLVDSYRGQAKEYNAVHYGLFVTYFPHLIAGPILHHRQMMPQFASAVIYKPNYANWAAGMTIFSIGLAKKVLLADGFAEFASPVFNTAENGVHQSAILAWSGAFAYTMQLYFDFSGYCDMAIGLSLLFNVKLPENFNSPYKARNIIEFWRRWHMTLSSFLKEYLYIPLGGNRYGQLRTYMNLIVTMLLGGLWHGANWTFVIWGALHGVYLLINHTWAAIWPTNSLTTLPSVWVRCISTGLTFLAVVFAWVFFRSTTVAAAWVMVSDMVAPVCALSLLLEPALAMQATVQSLYDAAATYAVLSLSLRHFFLLILVASVIVWVLPNTREYISGLGRIKWRPDIKTALFWGTLLALCLTKMTAASEFLYFQF